MVGQQRVEINDDEQEEVRKQRNIEYRENTWRKR